MSNDDDYRPTTGLVSEALFSIIGEEILGKSFLDLFSGSGYVGINAARRGAKYVVLNEKHKARCVKIKSNILKYKLLDVIDVFCLDWQRCIDLLVRKKMKFDYVYLDPPYLKRLKSKNLLESKLRVDYLSMVLNSEDFLNVLYKDSIIVCESFKDFEFCSDKFKYFELKLLKRYGSSKVFFLNLKK